MKHHNKKMKLCTCTLRRAIKAYLGIKRHSLMALHDDCGGVYVIAETIKTPKPVKKERS